MKKEDLEDELSNSGRLQIKALGLLRFVLRYLAPLAICLVFLNKLGLI